MEDRREGKEGRMKMGEGSREEGNGREGEKVRMMEERRREKG